MRSSKDSIEFQKWTRDWLDAVASGAVSMSQRSLARIESEGGGMDNVRAEAIARGVHLLLVRDDRGHAVVAASLEPFEVIC